MCESPYIKAYAVTRKMPINYSPEDKRFFENAFYYERGEAQLLRLEKANLYNNIISDLFNIYRSYCRIKPISFLKAFKKIWRFFLVGERISQGIWVTDEWSSEYFHWLTDVLPRILVLEPFLKEYRVLLPSSYEKKRYIQETLSKLGIQPTYINPKRRAVVKNLMSVEHTSITGNYNPEIIKLLKDKLVDSLEVTGQRKIYISRAKAAYRRAENEMEIQQLMKKYGYEIIFFEDYSVEEQMQIAAAAKVMVGMHGAGLTNMLFMPSGAKIVEIRNDAVEPINCFFSLASALEHDYYYTINPMVLTKGIKNENHLDYQVDIEHLEDVLKLLEC